MQAHVDKVYRILGNAGPRRQLIEYEVILVLEDIVYRIVYIEC